MCQRHALIKRCFSAEALVPPRGHQAMSEDVHGCHNPCVRGRVAVVHSRQRPEMLLNTHRAGTAPSASQRVTSPNVRSATARRFSTGSPQATNPRRPAPLPSTLCTSANTSLTEEVALSHQLHGLVKRCVSRRKLNIHSMLGVF